MDTFMGPGLIPSGRIMEALDVKIMKWPGHGMGKDVTMQQIVEGEYMKADEYDWLMMDPTDYNLRVTCRAPPAFLSRSRNCRRCACSLAAQAGSAFWRIRKSEKFSRP